MTRPLVASSVNLIKKLVLWIIALITRFPLTVALFGFVSGVASFLLVEREQEKFAQLVSALMLLSWGWLALENLLQRSVLSWFGFKLPPPLLSFATQLVHQESLFFVVPFFFITTVWNGGQMVFTSLLIIAAIISIVDPIYYRWVAAKRWVYFIFHGVTLFAVLLTALPIIFQLPTPKTYLLSLGIAILLSLPGIIRALPFNWWKRSVITIIGIVVVALIGVLVRAWIPPATLRLTEVAVTDRIDDKSRSPENSIKVITVDQLRSGLYAYTAIRAPRGLNERIYHVWRRNGRVVDKIALDISGGREAGYRAWTHKLNFPPYPSGRWQIHVVTEANQVIGILRFSVVESVEDVVVDGKVVDGAVIAEEITPVDKLREVLPEELIPHELEEKKETSESDDRDADMPEDKKTSEENTADEDDPVEINSEPEVNEASEEDPQRTLSADEGKQPEPDNEQAHRDVTEGSEKQPTTADVEEAETEVEDAEFEDVEVEEAEIAPDQKPDREGSAQSEATASSVEAEPEPTTEPLE